MVVMNRPVKIFMSTGALLLTVWVVLVVFTAYNYDMSEYEYVDFLLDETNEIEEKLPEPPFIEPKSIWRKMPLNEIAIPDATYELAKNETVVTSAEKVETVKLFIRTVKPQVPKSNKTFLFLHGSAFTSDVWDHLKTLTLFGALGYKCVAVDLPEHGQTTGKIGAVEAKKFVSKVAFMSALFDVLKLDNVIMVAPSFSGHYALPFALTKPKLLAGLVPIAPAASGIVPQSKLKTFEVPTLLIYGSKDNTLGPISNRDLRVIPNFQTVVMNNANHAAYLDQPDYFHNLLYNFARKVETVKL